MRRQANNIRGNHVLAGREVDVRLAGVESARPPILVSEESFHNNNTLNRPGFCRDKIYWELASPTAG